MKRNSKAMRRSLFLIFFACVSVFSVYSQQTLLLINGKEKEITSWRANKEQNKVFFIEKNETIEKKVSIDRTYSINKAGKPDTILYFRDSLEGNEMTLEQMHLYIMGMQHARKVYKSVPAFIGGFVSGMIGMPLLKFWGTGLPVIYTLFISFREPRIKGDEKLNPAISTSPYFIDGYRVMGKRIKVRNALLGGLLGTACAIVYQITL
ncbi:MAG: hypothetical protein V2A54_09130 [Bacteroidota bacterium]